MKRRDFIKKSVFAVGSTLLAGSAMKSLAAMNIDDAPSVSNESKQDKMKIVVLTGSPRRNGNSAYLADQFIKGAQEKGHEIYRFDCAFKQVEPCRACNRCGMDGPCIFNDDFSELRPHLIEADMVVFATPMYYFGISAQMKRVIDRFYAIKSDAEPMLQHYRTMMDYLGWESVGEVVAPGVWTAGSVRNTDYGDKAYRLGKSL